MPKKPPAGGGCKYEVPQGVVYDDAAFTSVHPWGAGAIPPSQWASAEGAIVHAFHHAYWGDWKFEVSTHDNEAETFHFARGGYQV